MKIIIYLGHPAQFHFSKNIILKLQNDGHQVKILLKTKDILEDLVKNSGFDYENIQKRSRSNNRFSILFASLNRTIQLWKIARKYHPDLLMGTDSSIAQAGFLLNLPTLTTLEDDYDVIEKLAKLTFPLTTSILVPDVCNVGRWKEKKISYQGYMKLAYLHPNHFKPDREIVNKYIRTENYCLIRLAQLTAHHDSGIKGLNENLIKNIINVIEIQGFKVYISSEADLKECFSAYQLKINHTDIHHVLAYATLLISDSQSMSVEAAMLGIPSIRFSDFAGRISVLEELEHKYHLTFGVSTSQPQKLLEMLEKLISTKDNKNIFQERQQLMLSDKIDVTAFFVWFIENYPESAKIMKQDPDYQFNFK
jgi:uncharacterized protein